MSAIGYYEVVDFVRPIEVVIPGVQGRLLAVLAETTAELNMRVLSELAGVSSAQASRILPELVQLGLVRRKDVPPSSLFVLDRANAAVKIILQLNCLRDLVLSGLADLAEELPVKPESIIVFGSFARRRAVGDSDIDVIMVRPHEVNDDDEKWGASVARVMDGLQRSSGNRVEILEFDLAEVTDRLQSDRPLWQDVQRDGIVVFGHSLSEMMELKHAE